MNINNQEIMRMTGNDDALENSKLKPILKNISYLNDLFFSDWLADILKPWDCYQQCWLDNTYLLIRFESCDVLYDITTKQACSIEHAESVLRLLENTSNNASYKESCIMWRSDTTQNDALGTYCSIDSVLQVFCSS